MSCSSAKGRKLPDWFSAKSYEWIEHLNIEMLLAVLEDRLWLCEDAFGDCDQEWAIEVGADFCAKTHITQPYLYSKHLRQLKEIEWPEDTHTSNEISLPSGYTASPLTAQFAWAALRDRWIREPQAIQDKCSIKNLSACSDFDISIEQDNGEVWLQLDLEQNSDDDIISDLKKMLPLWREKLKQPGPERQNKIGAGIIASIISFKIIPMMDLFIWGAVSGVKLTNAELLEALQPAGERDSLLTDLDSFRKTHLALFDKLYLSANYSKYGGGNLIERLTAWSIRIHPKLGAAPSAYKVNDLLVLLSAKA